MTTVTIPKTEYNLMRKIVETSKKQLANARLLESVQDKKNGNVTTRSREDFRKKFGV